MRPPPIPPAPAHAEGLRLHQALGSPSATATWDFARAYLAHLTAWLQATNPRAPADLCEEAAVELETAGRLRITAMRRGGCNSLRSPNSGCPASNTQRPTV